ARGARRMAIARGLPLTRCAPATLGMLAPLRGASMAHGTRRLTKTVVLRTLTIISAEPSGVRKVEGTSNIERPTLNIERDWLTADRCNLNAKNLHVTGNPDFLEER
ncbi:MAG: hypothetical protein KDA41_03905, partial [Planctomycetales bacterium]|nr:hypothetical protein [Planctomycetales bacterium]